MLPVEPTSGVGFGEVQGGHVSQRLKLSNAVVAERYNRDRKRKRGKGRKKVVGLVLLAAAHASCAIRGQNHQCHVSYGISEISYFETRIFLEDSRPTAAQHQRQTLQGQQHQHQHQQHRLCTYCAALLPSLVNLLFPVNRCCRLTVAQPPRRRRRISSERG
ncbi:hypothetical protein LCI18_008731 [Fusarium solani-melongenae]|uniref:Uncharacterized protein n=1 Tax=Fusarium solani subsp. cucurbitae TaxID=2747967 RepID=A0ACD3Z9A9_FUSSC|nr:hypothetical protein LCI18_008731 [Fusarium solani-melongenae]